MILWTVCTKVMSYVTYFINTRVKPASKSQIQTIFRLENDHIHYKNNHNINTHDKHYMCMCNKLLGVHGIHLPSDNLSLRPVSDIGVETKHWTQRSVLEMYFPLWVEGPGLNVENEYVCRLWQHLWMCVWMCECLCVHDVCGWCSVSSPIGMPN